MWRLLDPMKVKEKGTLVLKLQADNQLEAIFKGKDTIFGTVNQTLLKTGFGNVKPADKYEETTVAIHDCWGVTNLIQVETQEKAEELLQILKKHTN